MNPLLKDMIIIAIAFIIDYGISTLPFFPQDFFGRGIGFIIIFSVTFVIIHLIVGV